MFAINTAIGLLTAYVTFIILTFLVVCAILYMIVKIAVRNGVKEAIETQEQHLQSIQDLVFALVQEKYKQPDSDQH